MLKGAYVIEEDADYQVILTASGQEVGLCCAVKKLLNEKNVKVRVVSMPCWELFEKQPESYRQEVFPKNKFRAYVEMASTTFGLDSIILHFFTNFCFCCCFALVVSSMINLCCSSCCCLSF